MTFSYPSGLGKEVALRLAGMNPSRLILAVRNVKSGEEAASEIKAATGHLPEVWELDLSSCGNVVRFVERAKTELDRLDILVSVAWSAGR